MSCLGLWGSRGTDSSDEEEEEKVKPIAPAPSHGPGGPGSVEWKEDEWKEKTEEIWRRDINNLPAHTDIPRLGTKMKIFDDQGNPKMEEIPEDLPRHEMVQTLLLALSGALSDHESTDAISSKFAEYVDFSGKGDISQQLLRFFAECLPSEGRTVKILKACHQKIVFPGFYHVKARLFDKLPFKDLRGTWSMTILLFEKHIEIRHRKAQVSQNKSGDINDAGDEFNFEWELRMKFDLQMEAMTDVDVAVVQINFRGDVSQDRKGQITDIIRAQFPVDS